MTTTAALNVTTANAEQLITALAREVLMVAAAFSALTREKGPTHPEYGMDQYLRRVLIENLEQFREPNESLSAVAALSRILADTEDQFLFRRLNDGEIDQVEYLIQSTEAECVHYAIVQRLLAIADRHYVSDEEKARIRETTDYVVQLDDEDEDEVMDYDDTDLDNIVFYSRRSR